MKKLLLLFTFISLAYVGVGQTTTIDFETDGDGYTASATEGLGDTDVFNRSNPNIGGNSSFIWAVEDLSLTDPYITLDQIDINGATSFTFSIDMIAHHYNDWDSSDELLITYSVDDGAYQNLMWVENIGATYNQTAALDTDFDGVGECDYVLPSLTTGTSGCTSSSDVFETFTSSSITLNSNTTLDIKLQFKGLTSNDEGIYIDNITITQSGGSGNNPPSISNISQTPSSDITSSDAVSVSADVTDDDGILGVELHWGTSSGSLGTTIAMSNTGSDTYTTDTDIPAQSGGTTVYYEVYAIDYSGDALETTSAEQSYTVLKDEPSSHVDGFSATANSSSQITTTWTDAVGETLPDGYLVKAATGGNPTAPVDGTAESDGTLVKNIAHGSKGEAVFTGLDAETDYNFMVWSYTNSGVNIDYKTDGTIPSASATTHEAPVTPDLIISEVTDPGDVANAKYVELYNAGSTVIDLNGWSIRRYANGNATSADVDLTGHSLAPNQTLTIAYNSTFTTEYGFNADIENGNISGNGDDVYELYDGSNTVDIYGEIGVDGTGEAWEYENSRAVRNSNITSPNATWTASEWTITSADVADMTPGEHNDYVSVKSNGNWNTASNWSNGSVPTSTENVVVPANTELTIVSTKATGTCKDITIEDGATLVGQENLTVNGTIYVKKSFTAYSSATASDGWYAISSPVSSMTISGSDFEPGANDDLYEYDENGNMWLNYTGGTFGDTDFDARQGYLVSYETTATKSFEGTAFNSDGISATIGETNTNWNLIGNPYPSKLTYDNINAINISSPKSLNASTGAWDDDITGGEVEVGEGIFVYAEGSSSMTFNLDDQTHGSGKKATPSYAFLRANFDDGLSVFARFGTDASASKNYEWKYDSRYLYPATSIPYLSTITADEVMASTYVFNDDEESVIVPLYFSVNSEREITFSTDGNIGYQMAIEDNIDGSITEIDAENPFVFTALPADADNRFNLHLTKASTIGLDENEELAGVHVYANKRNIYFNADENLTNATLTVYNTIGQVVLTTDVETGSEIIRMDDRGAYIVKVQSNEGSITEKVIIK